MSPVPRRSLFAAGMGLTLAGLGLAACSSPASTSTGDGAGSGGNGSTTSGASTPSSSKGGGAASANTVKVADVPVGGGVIMTTASFVVTQPTAGSFKAFSNVCTHQGCPVSSIANGAIICSCHGSQFSVKDGSVISGPARKALAGATVTQSGDSLVVS